MFEKKRKNLFVSVPMAGVGKDNREDVLNGVRVRLDNELERTGQKDKYNVIVMPDVKIEVVD